MTYGGGSPPAGNRGTHGSRAFRSRRHRAGARPYALPPAAGFREARRSGGAGDAAQLRAPVGRRRGAAREELERLRPFGKPPSRARDPRPLEMRAAEPPSPEARRDGGVSVEVRAQRAWPAGRRMVENGRIRWRYLQRYRGKYRQRKTLAQ